MDKERKAKREEIVKQLDRLVASAQDEHYICAIISALQAAILCKDEERLWDVVEPFVLEELQRVGGELQRRKGMEWDVRQSMNAHNN